jgi:hypothetical protein
MEILLVLQQRATGIPKATQARPNLQGTSVYPNLCWGECRTVFARAGVVLVRGAGSNAEENAGPGSKSIFIDSLQDIGRIFE